MPRGPWVLHLKLEPKPWTFAPQNIALFEKYKIGFDLTEIMSQNGSPAPGIVTTQDEFAISWNQSEAAKKVRALLSTQDESEARGLFRLCSQAQWNYENAKRELSRQEWEKQILPISYRPFDNRFTVYNPHVAVHRRDRVSRHMAFCENIALAVPRSTKDDLGGLVIDRIAGHKIFSAYDINFIFPLYLYPSEQDLDQTRRVNFDPKLYKRLQSLAKHPSHGTPDEVAVFDYIYGVLHCPAYRATYVEFLKIDFPRVPWPATPDEFWDISTKGTTLRKLHLMDPATIGPAPYPFKGEGDAVVEKPRFDDGKVWINPTQYFDAAPAVSWGFYIGGYQPAQKWLKDRKGRALSFEDVKHYQRILKILSETDRIMATITMELASPDPAL